MFFWFYSHSRLLILCRMCWQVLLYIQNIQIWTIKVAQDLLQWPQPGMQVQASYYWSAQQQLVGMTTSLHLTLHCHAEQYLSVNEIRPGRKRVFSPAMNSNPFVCLIVMIITNNVNRNVHVRVRSIAYRKQTLYQIYIMFDNIRKWQRSN